MRRLLPLIAIVLVISGCKARIDSTVTVEEDESGAFRLEFSLDDELRQLLEDQGTADLLTLTETFGEVPDGWTLDEFVEGDFEGIFLATEFVDLDDLNAKLVQLQGVLDDGNLAAPEAIAAFRLDHVDDQFIFEADLTGLDEGVDQLGAIAGDNLGGLDPAQIFETIFETRFIVTLPGTIEEHNADAVEVNTLQWEIGLQDSGRTLRAVSTVAESSNLMSFLGLGAIILAIVIVAALLISRRNRRREEELAAARMVDAAGL